VGELIASILPALAEVFFELLLEFAGGAIVELLLRAGRRLFGALLLGNQFVSFLAMALLGAGFGFGSVYFFPHSLTHPSKYHGISLVISPLIVGFAMAQVGKQVRRRGAETVAIESFGYGYVLAFSMAIVRFLLVR
jgi:hypothetical protein